MDIAISIILLIIIIPTAYAAVIGAPIVPSTGKNIKRALIEAGVGEGSCFYELGTGTGRVSREALKMGASVTGFELSPLAWIWSFISLASVGKPFRLKFRNFFKEDLCDADVLYIFLMPEPIKKLAKKIEKELRKGSTVISYVFPITSREPERIISEEGQANIYIYKV
jgi:SAM-dependent methyltransferase